MRIQDSQVQLAGQHDFARQHSIEEQQSVAVRRVPRQASVETVNLSSESLAAQQAEARSLDLRSQLENDPLWRLIKHMIKQITGEDVDLDNIIPPGAGNYRPASKSDVANSQQSKTQNPQQDRAQLDFHYRYREEYHEVEKTSFVAAGKVRADDGREIDFKAALNMHREYHEVSEARIDTGNTGTRKDPLVINFDTDTATLGPDKIHFDLDADGTAETMSFLAPGSGFLAMDRNGDGKVNNGTELFGAQSGDGFADLSQLDDDGNGWIDENDASWVRLRLWTRDAGGQFQLVDLKSRGIGAIYLGNTDTEFSLTDQQNREHGLIRRTGIYLKEDGKAGTVQQLDLTV
ncbi:hypothetical protein [Chitinimonas naiadis]